MSKKSFIDFLFWENEEIIIGTWSRGGILTFNKKELLEYYEKGFTFWDLEVDKKISLEEEEIKQLPEEVKKDLDGFIYIIKSGEFYKIGKTININNRFKKYITENPNRIELVYYFYVKNYSIEEEKLHDIFKHKQHNREWFKLDPEDILYIKTLW